MDVEFRIIRLFSGYYLRKSEFISEKCPHNFGCFEGCLRIQFICRLTRVAKLDCISF